MRDFIDALLALPLLIDYGFNILNLNNEEEYRLTKKIELFSSNKFGLTED